MNVVFGDGYLKTEQFQLALRLVPLVSIDLCILSPEDDILLGLRKNRPAKGYWFTPGGRVRKGETLASAVARIFLDELGLGIDHFPVGKLMGVWDHLFSESVFKDNEPTHYVNIPYLYKIDSGNRHKINQCLSCSGQHSRWSWVSLNSEKSNLPIHHYAYKYIEWIQQHEK